MENLFFFFLKKTKTTEEKNTFEHKNSATSTFKNIVKQIKRHIIHQENILTNKMSL